MINWLKDTFPKYKIVGYKNGLDEKYYIIEERIWYFPFYYNEKYTDTYENKQEAYAAMDRQLLRDKRKQRIKI